MTKHKQERRRKRSSGLTDMSGQQEVTRNKTRFGNEFSGLKVRSLHVMELRCDVDSLFTWNSLHTELTTRGTHYTWNSLHVELTTHGTHYTWNSLHVEITTRGTHYTWNSLHVELTTRGTHYTSHRDMIHKGLKINQTFVDEEKLQHSNIQIFNHI